MATFAAELKDQTEISLKESCLNKHGKCELLPAHRAILICKTNDLEENPNGHKPVVIFTSLEDNEILYHMVSLKKLNFSKIRCNITH